MAGPAVEKRLQLLRQSADQQILKPLETHGWTAKIESENPDGEYFIIEASKDSTSHRIALLYTSATANGVYKTLDGAVEHIFTNGELYNIEQYAYGIATPVLPIGDFFPVLVAWNKQIAPGVNTQLPTRGRPRLVRHITAENPLAGIWSRLDQFGSVVLAERLILRRAAESGITLAPEALKAKAAGVAFSLRNASDYTRVNRAVGRDATGYMDVRGLRELQNLKELIQCSRLMSCSRTRSAPGQYSQPDSDSCRSQSRTPCLHLG